MYPDSASQNRYDEDIYNWTKAQIAYLQTREFESLDIKNLIEELEDMGKSTLRELESRLMILLAHLLKWQFQFNKLAEQWQAFEGKSWRNTIIEQRAQILFLLKKVPSLKAKIADAVEEAYPEAVALASKESGIAVATFPLRCPYTLDQLLDEDFFPQL
ncbi:DUF29 domain-containing protein [Ectothiorhodospiraceae bacterium BW-2]|nr:DUF29 domain-containing protein [Ectothiorhodospiraceae bacterium BW-2]